MKAAHCLAAAMCLAVPADLIFAHPAVASGWTIGALDKVVEAALAAAPEQRYASTREYKLLALGLAFQKSGDQPAAHLTFVAAAATAETDSGSPDGFRIMAVPRMAAAGAVEDAKSLANSAVDARLRDKLIAAVEQAHSGGPNPFETPAGNAAVSADADTAPNTDDVDSWLAYARAKVGKGDVAAARTAALHASQLALAVDPATLSTSLRIEHLVLLGRVAGALADVGAYDEAVTAVQPIEFVNRGQYYLTIVDAAIRAHDARAVRRRTSITIAALTPPDSGWGPVQNLHRLVKALAMAGYGDEARATFAALKMLYDNVSAPVPPNPDPVMIAECQALTGDLPAALATAEATGPLVTPPGSGMAVMATVSSYADTETQPTQAELAPRLAEMQKRMPALVPGVKARALADIVAAIAATGHIGQAIELEPELEVEPRDVLTQPRDQALEAIAEAQQKVGDLEASLTTALRITGRDARFARLLALAAEPPRP